MDRIITTFIKREFPDYEGRIKDYKNLLNAYIEQSKDSTYYFQYISICTAMLITLETIRDELLIHGLDFKTKIGSEQRETMMQKMEEMNKRTIELGIDRLLPSFKWKAEKEEKKAKK